MANQKADHKLKVSITADGKKVADVMCEVYLPKRLTESIELKFKPLSNNRHFGYPFKFSIFGKLKNIAGDNIATIEAKKVYYQGGGTTYWGDNISETEISGMPTDLTITSVIKREKPLHKTTGNLWLTPSIMLSPLKSLKHYYSGKVTSRKVRNFKFTLPCGLKLIFDHHYRYIDGSGNDTISFPELVAEFDNFSKTSDINVIIQELDDLLMITSFSARQRCVCLGWDIYESTQHIKHYRRDIAIPDSKADHSINDVLIEPRDFKKFIRIVYKNFTTATRKDLLRQAIHGAIERNQTIESNFMGLFSSLETLVFFHRNSENLEKILNDSEWRTIFKDIKKFIKNHELLTEKNQERSFMYEKLPEMNRIAFSSAFEDFCIRFNLSLSDLWPVVNRKGGMSLTDIRNKLIHGDSFSHLQQVALMSAVEHLKWILERSILAVLGWPHEESKVCKSYLNTMTMYKEWRDDRKILTENN